ncbi:MAG: hypothetical protein RLY43_1359 [Bacteroidota bacterium]|jgi:hypothetical protein
MNEAQKIVDNTVQFMVSTQTTAFINEIIAKNNVIIQYESLISQKDAEIAFLKNTIEEKDKELNSLKGDTNND